MEGLLDMARAGRERPLYMISVAAELAGVHPQTLRIYERKQLICPQRSGGNTRLYSEADIERLRAIQHMTQNEGINLAGVERIIALEREIDRLRSEAEAMRTHVRKMERDRISAERANHVRTALVRVHRGPVARRGEEW